mmetsp:Transcript_37058/g.55191  ORF Transcript_37058/g.55191 Transcript_37058/m.55191 type:complete len:232 (-) Transcript_37058:90-785(-)
MRKDSVNPRRSIGLLFVVTILVNAGATNAFVRERYARGSVFQSPSLSAGLQRNKNGAVLFARSDKDGDDDEEFTMPTDSDGKPKAVNVLGTPLECCCANVRNSGVATGFYRNGFCATGPNDFGRHTVCVRVTKEFLLFSQQVGNDLSTPVPQYQFPGLKDGDIWCLCAQRWVEAFENGIAPKVYLKATHEKSLTYTDIDSLRAHALDLADADESVDELNEQRAKLDKLFES